MKTRSEKLQNFKGKIECDICHEKKPFNDRWLMTDGATIVCPECQPRILSKGSVLVSI